MAYAGFAKDRADWYFSFEELKNTASKIIEISKNNAHIGKGMIQEFLPWQKAFYQACHALQKKDLSKLHNDELLKTYHDLSRIYTNKLNSSPLIDGFALSTDVTIAAKIKMFLEEKNQGENFVEYFTILISPTYDSFLQEEEIALLEIAKKIKIDPALEQPLLARHQKKYFWIRNNYVEDHIENIDAFSKRVKTFKKFDVDKKIQEMKSAAKNNRKAKNKLMKELNLRLGITTLLEITDDFNAWQDERKGHCGRRIISLSYSRNSRVVQNILLTSSSMLFRRK